jgi:hypothetical protein
MVGINEVQRAGDQTADEFNGADAFGTALFKLIC